MMGQPGTRRGLRWTAALASILLVVGWAAFATTGCPGARDQASSDTPTPSAQASRPAALEKAPAVSARNLANDEARGGHTLARHVGLTDDDLRARLRRERRISAASTWTDRATAERVVYATLAPEPRDLTRWVARQGRRPNLALPYRGDGRTVIGRALMRGSPQVVACYDAIVVLRWDEARGDFFVLTAYPEVRP